MYRFVPDAAWTEPRRAGLYSFDLSNPARYIDPDGRNPGTAGGAAVGAAIGSIGGAPGVAIGAGVGAIAGTIGAVWAGQKLGKVLAKQWHGEATQPLGQVLSVPKTPPADTTSKTAPDVTTTSTPSPSPEPPGDCEPGGGPLAAASDVLDAVSQHIDVTGSDSKTTNRETNVTRAEFEANLADSGFTKSESADGKATRWTGPDGQTYTVRNNADSHPGPTADFRKCGPKGKPDIKIRMPE